MNKKNVSSNSDKCVADVTIIAGILILAITIIYIAVSFPFLPSNSYPKVSSNFNMVNNTTFNNTLVWFVNGYSKEIFVVKGNSGCVKAIYGVSNDTIFNHNFTSTNFLVTENHTIIENTTTNRRIQLYSLNTSQLKDAYQVVNLQLRLEACGT